MNLAHTPLEWIVFAVVAIVAIVIDIIQTAGKEPNLRTSIWQTVAYVSLGLSFGVFVWWERGLNDASLYWTGFVVEKTLSVDNIFVMGLIFASLGIPPKNQRLLLYLGIIGAVVFRGLFLWGGTALISRFAWTLPALGVLLLIPGLKVLLTKEGDDEGEEPFMARKVKQWGLSTFVAAIVAIEVTDVIFAIDSIPAILAISSDVFIVFTSNMFALLGLRSLYFCLQGVKAEFHYLPKALGIVLMLIGVKSLLPIWHIHFPTWISLIVVVCLIAGGIILSLVFPQVKKAEEAEAEARKAIE